MTVEIAIYLDIDYEDEMSAEDVYNAAKNQIRSMDIEDVLDIAEYLIVED